MRLPEQPSAAAGAPWHPPRHIAGPRSERKFITVLFADVVGSTALVDGLDPEDADARLQPAVAAMLDAVHLYGGTVSTLRGDGLSALFGAPTAYEDHAARACLAGIAMLRGVSVAEAELRIRVGIHSGEVLVRSLATDFTRIYEATGPTVHVAARMEQLALPGTVRITRATRDLVRGVVRERSLGATKVRGFGEAIELYEIAAATAHRTRWEVRAESGLTPFVGRKGLIEQLHQAWRVAAGGCGRALLLLGEPGVGKSRVLHEFLGASSRRGQPTYVAASSSYETQSTFIAASRMMRQWFGVEDGDPPHTAAARVAERVPALALEEQRAMRSLLDDGWTDEAWRALEPLERRQRVIDVAVRFFGEQARVAPVIIAFEDVHWMDGASLELIGRLAAEIRSQRVLLLCTGRPEPELQQLEGRLETLPVESLEYDEALAMLDRLLGNGAELAEFKRALIAKTSATPLFLEEIVQSFVETGVLLETAAGFRLSSQAAGAEVPASVQAVLAARLDRLPLELIGLLQKAAVIGESGSHRLLQRLSSLQPQQHLQHLELLERRGFLHRTGDRAEAFSFRHALTRDVVYESILAGARQAAHLDVVTALEEMSSEVGPEGIDILARHALAGRDWRRAATYSRGAARRAYDLSALKESAEHFRCVLSSLDKLGTGRELAIESIDALLDLRRVLFALGELAQVEGHLRQAIELSERIGDEPRLAAASIFLSNLYSHRGQLREALESGSKALKVAHRLADPSLVVSASIVLSLAYEFGGRSRDSVDCLAPLATVIDVELDHPHFVTSASFSVQCLSILAGAYAGLGRFDEAEASAGRALEVARRLGRPYDLGLGHYYLALALLRRGAIGEAENVLRQGLSAAVGFVVPWLSSALGYALVLTGRLADGAHLLEESLKRARQIGLDFLETRITAWLALAAALKRDHEAARRSIALAASRSGAHDYRELEAWSLRLQAALEPAAPGAEAAAARALEIVESLGLASERSRSLRVLAACREANDPSGAGAMRAKAADIDATAGIGAPDLETAAMLSLAA